MEEKILEAKNDLDSVGGVIECMVTGLPAGIGDPFFDSVESQLSHMMFSVPAVKGIEFGDASPWQTSAAPSQRRLLLRCDTVKTRTNHNGGINGGITNGMPVVFRLAVKPTASISQKQETIDTDTQENCDLVIKAATILHRPARHSRLEAAAAWAILDVCLSEKGRCW
mgnify:CR=1 FL=1